MNDLLVEIINHKQREVADAKQLLPLEILKNQAANAPVPRDFLQALQQKLALQQPAVIAEIKKASPSKGVIRQNFDPLAIALDYTQAGAACLSVLTDEKFFQGSKEYLQQIRASCDLPLLRKDFIIDAYQIYEARLIGADAILLIAAVLTDQQLQEFCQLAQTLGLQVLVEIHDRAELQRALKLPTPLLGINNRNLRSFTTHLATTLELLPEIPSGKVVISESGINTAKDIHTLRQQGVHTFLIGEALMRAPQPGAKLAELLGA